MIPLRFLFRSRWFALIWAIGMIATAVSVADMMGGTKAGPRQAGAPIVLDNTAPALNGTQAKPIL